MNRANAVTEEIRKRNKREETKISLNIANETGELNGEEWWVGKPLL